ncbi:MAG: hypothetical protein JW827_05810 [Spirochaetes bacterium]|nr:hypothetical protein [Spirochaetota bacterium]
MKRFVIVVISLILFTTTLWADIETTLYKTALDLATKPNNLFIEINNDIENTVPNFLSRRFQIHTSILWNLFTVGNGQLRYRINDESGFPEVTPGISGWYLWGLTFLPEEDFSAKVYGLSPFVTFGKSLERNVKFFIGSKYTYGKIDLNWKSTQDQDTSAVGMADDFGFDLSSLAGISSVYQDVGFYTGITYQRDSGREVSALIGYYPSWKKIYSKIQVSGSLFDYGMSLYPDSYMLLHLYLNLHINI